MDFDLWDPIELFTYEDIIRDKKEKEDPGNWEGGEDWSDDDDWDDDEDDWGDDEDW